jgi:hypothetical protein
MWAETVGRPLVMMGTSDDIGELISVDAVRLLKCLGRLAWPCMFILEPRPELELVLLPQW